MEYGQFQAQGVNIPRSAATSQFFIERIRILSDMILPGWEDNEFKDRMEKLPKDEVQAAHQVFRAILGLLHRRGNIRFKPPRDPAD